MRSFGRRFTIFAAGLVFGGLIAGFIVMQHHRVSQAVAAQAEAEVLDPQLPPDLHAAVAGILRYYGQGRGPIHHRMIEEVRILPEPLPGRRQVTRHAAAANLAPAGFTFESLPPGAFSREIVLQGEQPDQRLLVRETVQPPPPLVGLAPESLSPEQLEACRVIAWTIVRPNQLVIVCTRNTDPGKVAERMGEWHGTILRRLQSVTSGDVLLAELGERWEVSMVLRKIAEMPGELDPWLLEASEHSVGQGSRPALESSDP